MIKRISNNKRTIALLTDGKSAPPPKRRKHGSGDETPPPSILKEESVSMYNELRELIQQGERAFARVNQRDHEERLAQEDLNNESMMQHPYLNSQQYDGIDPNVTPVPTDDPELWRRFQAELELQKKLRMELNNAPQFSHNIKPRGPI